MVAARRRRWFGRPGRAGPPVGGASGRGEEKTTRRWLGGVVEGSVSVAAVEGGGGGSGGRRSQGRRVRRGRRSFLRLDAFQLQKAMNRRSRWRLGWTAYPAGCRSVPASCARAEGTGQCRAAAREHTDLSPAADSGSRWRVATLRLLDRSGRPGVAAAGLPCSSTRPNSVLARRAPRGSVTGRRPTTDGLLLSEQGIRTGIESSDREAGGITTSCQDKATA